MRFKGLFLTALTLSIANAMVFSLFSNSPDRIFFWAVRSTYTIFAGAAGFLGVFIHFLKWREALVLSGLAPAFTLLYFVGLAALNLPTSMWTYYNIIRFYGEYWYTYAALTALYIAGFLFAKLVEFFSKKLEGRLFPNSSPVSHT